MKIVGERIVRRKEKDGSIEGDKSREVGEKGKLDGIGNRIMVVKVERNGVKEGRGEKGWMIGIVGKSDREVDRDVVVIKEKDKIVEIKV